MTAPLIITRDDTLLDELLRLGAAAGVVPDVAHDVGAALRGWSTAPLVLLGTDLLADAARLAVPRRERVHIVAWGTVPHEVFPLALAVGAENVAELPRSDTWVVDALTDLGDGDRPSALTVGVVGGSGGAGATTFACALAQRAASAGPALVIDTDPLGPGVDRVLGFEMVDGVRWDALQQTTGRLGARSLREAVPRRDRLGALTWSAGPQGTLQAFAVREALSAAQRGHDVVVLDLSRSLGPLVEELVARCDQLIVVAVPTVPGVASARRLCARLEAVAQPMLVLRGRGIDPDEVAQVVGAPVLAAMPDQRGLAEAIDLGAGPVRSARGALGRAADTVLAGLQAPVRGVA
ncbi:septum site-determining protein Ssd [Nocardioides speluncae]|uniref:septum site-determining protein Ssd n=1 Tax=Nocardioides speluncae TaxID=2670337 RepID=UPI000D69148B|nr:septum site-determining protein Ssd [Nocardioides speluncae]